jgi:hypothetical protein
MQSSIHLLYLYWGTSIAVSLTETITLYCTQDLPCRSSVDWVRIITIIMVPAFPVLTMILLAWWTESVSYPIMDNVSNVN